MNDTFVELFWKLINKYQIKELVVASDVTQFSASFLGECLWGCHAFFPQEYPVPFAGACFCIKEVYCGDVM